VALVVNFLSAFVAGFILAYARSWRLALALSSILPCIAITGGVMNKFISSYMRYVNLITFFANSHYSGRLSLKHVAEGGNLAEEVISTVRTAQAFGAQTTLASLYDGFVNKSLQVDMKAAVWHGTGLGVFFFVIYSAYALGSFMPFSFYLRLMISF
jgi:ATP-binding cassette subfamily B (MDR/TAP) protein 1